MAKRAEHSPISTGHRTGRIARGSMMLCCDPAAPDALPDDVIELARHVAVQIIAKDLEALATLMHGADSFPDCLIIALGDNTNAALNGLERLASSLPDTTRVFAFGPINDIGFYRALLDLGIEDYFVGPVSKDMITAVQARLDASDIRDSGAIIGIQGVAGGVGTSTFAMNLAAYMCSYTDRHVSMIETGDALRSCRYLLNPARLATLSPVDDTTLDEVILSAPDQHDKHAGFRLTMPRAGANRPADTDTAHAQHTQADLVSVAMRRRTNREIVILDLGGSPNPAALLAQCDHIVLVAEPDFKCLALCRRQVNDANSRYPYAVRHLVITQSGIPSRTEFRIADFEKETGIAALSAYRYHAPTWTAAMAQGFPFLPSSLLRDPDFFETLLKQMGLERFQISRHHRGFGGAIRSLFDRFFRRED